MCITEECECVYGRRANTEPHVYFRAWIHTCADSPSVSGHSPGLETQSLSVLSTRCDIFVGSTVPVRDWTHLIY